MQAIFHERSFASAIRAGDSRRFHIDLKNERQKILEAAISHANAKSIVFGPYHTSMVKGRSCTSLPDYSQNLILRIASNYISRRFRVEVGGRDRKVISLIEALTDSAPFFVIRRDIRSFYETVPTAGLRKRLVNGSELPPSIRGVIEAYFQTFCVSPLVGLPRGICLSAILSELAMQDFDSQVRNLSGVHRYFRYSDDIIILTFSETDDIESKLPDLLPTGMSFNTCKSDRIDVDKTSKQATAAYFEYLGYGFTFPNHGYNRDPRTVEVSIAKKKLDRLKTRLVCAFKSHQKKPDFPLLKRRIQFMAGNVVVMRQNVTAVKSSRYVKSGIYYNYRLCGEYKGGNVYPYNGDELKGVDGFYHSLITQLTKHGTTLTASQESSLRTISFYKGYSLKYTSRFKMAQIQEIKSVWKNA